MERWNVQQRVTCVRSFGDIAWHARSPELTVPEFFLSGFLKDRVFWRRIMTIQDLKQAIVDEVAAIDEDLRRRVYGNFQTLLQKCIDVNGGHLPAIQKISWNLCVINSTLVRIYRRFRLFFSCFHILSMTIWDVSVGSAPPCIIARRKYSHKINRDNVMTWLAITFKVCVPTYSTVVIYWEQPNIKLNIWRNQRWVTCDRCHKLNKKDVQYINWEAFTFA